ncbi:MAG: RnfABCDGE type electron transport complex subunit D, partial [Bacteroidales bacterium]
KEVFGGTGMNIWNPALIARAFLFFAYPAQISGDKVWIAEKADAFSGATALSKISGGQVDLLPSLHDMFWGFMPGSVGETSKFCILLGAIILLWTGIASFRVMFSVILGGAGMTLLLNLCAGPEASVMHIGPLYQLLMGGFLFGAVFMASDPVTSAQTNTGKLIYGFLTGVLAILIRVFNPAYPEGMMLAILFMNTFAPLIDYVVVHQNIKRREKRLKQSSLESQNK